MKIRMTKTVVLPFAHFLLNEVYNTDAQTGAALIGMDAAVLVSDIPAKGRQKAVMPQYETR